MKFLDKYIKFAEILCRYVAKRYDIIDGKKLLTIKQKRNLAKTRQKFFFVSFRYALLIHCILPST